MTSKVTSMRLTSCPNSKITLSNRAIQTFLSLSSTLKRDTRSGKKSLDFFKPLSTVKFCRCHRAVLASTSRVFSSLLKEMTDHDPSLVLCDITNDELETLISFLYTGLANFNSASEYNRFTEILNHYGVLVTSQLQV